MRLKDFIAAVAWLVVATPLWAKTFKLAVIGDSYSTGAWAVENLELSEKSFTDRIFSGQRTPPRLRLTPPHISEYRSPMHWVVQNTLFAFTSTYVDDPDQSWVSYYAKAQNIPLEEVLVMARDGADTYDASAQVKAMLALTDGVAPEKTVLFFSLMDVCAPSINLMTSPEFYTKRWEDALRNFVKFAKNIDQVKVEVWAPLSLTQAVRKESILNKSINVDGKAMTCKELAARPVESIGSGPAQALYLLHPMVYCSSLMQGAHEKVEPGKVGNVYSVANQFRFYRQSLESLVKSMNKELEKPVFVYRDALANFTFEPEIMGPDCLHLNALGHKTLAEFVINKASTL